jgi:uncharacterized Rmd1/YagE family protein
VPLFAFHAYGLAATFKPRDLSAAFAPAPARPGKSQLIATLGAEQRVLAFDFGAVVFFNTPEEERTRIMQLVLARLPPEPHPPLIDDFLLEVAPGTPPSVGFDRIVVPELADPVVELCALLLAQSVAMDYYAEDVSTTIRRLSDAAERLSTLGRLRGRQRELLRFIGSCMVTRNQIVATLSLLDKPDITWEHELYDRLYRELRQNLEIDERFRALEFKLGMIQDNLELLVDLARHRRMLFLEVTIVVLILIEVAIAVWQIAKVSGGHG